MTLRVENLRNALVGPFSFSVDAGDCLAITGASGSGKTLLLRMIADLDPNEGDVTLDAEDRATLSAYAWRLRVGMVPARSGWWHERVDAHFVDVAGERLALARRLLLPDSIFERGVDQASTGERQRLAVIRALLKRPRVLLLDEPTASLDPSSTQAVEQVLLDARADGMALVIVTHDAAQAQRLAPWHLPMSSGVMVPA